MTANKRWTLDEAQALIRENNAHCPTCSHKLAIYKYKANRSAAVMLRKIADVVRDSGTNKVNYDDIPVPHALHSQRSKLRQHGLIAKYKENGTHVANMWLITNKGWDWLTGKPIPAVVLVFDNQVLGHDGGEITIHEAIGDKTPTTFDQKAITPAEARAYRGVHDEPKRKVRYNAIYKASGYSDQQPKKGQQYEIAMDKLQMGKPLKVECPLKGDLVFHAEYKDIAAFQKAWQIVGGAL